MARFTLKRAALAACALLALGASVQAQSVQQSGTVTPGHAARWTSNGVIQDAGTAANGNLTSLGVTTNGSGICQNSAAVTAAGYQQICLGATTAGGGFISVQNFGSALPKDLTFNINGTPVTVPTGGGAIATITLPVNPDEFICGYNTLGVLKSCGYTTVPIAAGGTGATAAGTARTNLGLGTISTQAADNVAITGGTVTGMPAPSLASDVANKQYVDSVAQGLTIHTPVRLATATVLPNSPTYSNGASGVGATLTAGSMVALTVDGTSVSLNDRILVKNQVTAANNGVYTVTTVGDGANAWVLTRATDFDTAPEMLQGSYFLVTAGSTNISTSWTLQTTVVTVGSSPVTFVQFSTASTGVTEFTVAAGAGTQVSGTCTVNTTGTCTVQSAPTYTAVTGTNVTYDNSYGVETVGRSNSGTLMVDTIPGTGAGVLAAGLYRITNQDATALLSMQVAAGATLDGTASKIVVLGPGQGFIFSSNGSNYFTVSAPPRTRLGANTTVHVNVSTGSNSNNCLASGTACQTLQAIYDKLGSQYDFNCKAVTIQLATGTYSLLDAPGGLTGRCNPATDLTIQGDVGTPANVVLTTGSGNTIKCYIKCALRLTGLTITNTASGGNAILVEGQSYLQIGPSVRFGATTNTHMYIQDSSWLEIFSNYSIVGNATNHIVASLNAVVQAQGLVVTVAGGPSISGSILQADHAGMLVWSSSFSGGFNGTAQAYNVYMNGGIDAGGGCALLPGNNPGVINSGGQCP